MRQNVKDDKTALWINRKVGIIEYLMVVCLCVCINIVSSSFNIYFRHA